jgi:hypothetical protein
LHFAVSSLSQLFPAVERYYQSPTEPAVFFLIPVLYQDKISLVLPDSSLSQEQETGSVTGGIGGPERKKQ